MRRIRVCRRRRAASRQRRALLSFDGADHLDQQPLAGIRRGKAKWLARLMLDSPGVALLRSQLAAAALRVTPDPAALAALAAPRPARRPKRLCQAGR